MHVIHLTLWEALCSETLRALSLLHSDPGSREVKSISQRSTGAEWQSEIGWSVAPSTLWESRVLVRIYWLLCITHSAQHRGQQGGTECKGREGWRAAGEAILFARLCAKLRCGAPCPNMIMGYKTSVGEHETNHGTLPSVGLHMAARLCAHIAGPEGLPCS